MNLLRWAPYPGSDVAGYRVYRSMVGFSVPVVSPSAVAGLDLEVAFNGEPSQTILFSGESSLATQLNESLSGAMAFLTEDESRIHVRSNVRDSNGSVEIIGGTALSVLELTPRTITEKSEDELVAELVAPNNETDVVTFDDPDGVVDDWYAVSTVSSTGSESYKTPYRQPAASTGGICVIEGIVVDLQGVRIPDAEVKATLIKFPQMVGVASQITKEPIIALTREDGRFSLPLLQGALVLLEIPRIGYSHAVEVPCKALEFITNLTVDTSYRYPLEVT